MIYFRCYIEAFESATVDVSMLEDGAYNRLLRHYYRTEEPLPLNSDKLARICKAISLEERAAISSVLDRFFIQRPDGWHNERADHEIAVSKTARTNGSRGGRPSDAETGNGTGSQTGSKTEQQTGSKTGVGAGSGHPSSLSTKTSLSTIQPSTQLPSARATRSGPKVDTGETWMAYSTAYMLRYGVEPVRNARVNGQLANLVRCIGATEAPAVAAFYVRHNRFSYVRAKHSTGLLASDAEGLRTEWATGRSASEAEARQADRTMANGNAFAPLIEQAKAIA